MFVPNRERPGLALVSLALMPPPHCPRLNFLTVRVDGAFSGPGWGTDLPDWLPLLCLSPLKDPTAFPVPTFQDLAGFWDLLQLSIEDVTLKFLELQQLKANSWKLLEPKVGESPFKPKGQTGKCPSPDRPVVGRGRGTEDIHREQRQSWTGDGDHLLSI